MIHLHEVTDLDPYFEIDPDTRELIFSLDDKPVLIQGDHNSEIITFKVPRTIEGHDMGLCNVVQIHYINIDSTNNFNRNNGVYEVLDFKPDPDSNDYYIFSWPVSLNATSFVGPLSFSIRFACTSGSKVTYAWYTAICKDITVSAGINNSEATVEQYTDILENWYWEFVSVTTSGVNVIVDARDKALQQIIDAGALLSSENVSSIVHETGNSEKLVISQKAMTEIINGLRDQIDEYTYEYEYAENVNLNDYITEDRHLFCFQATNGPSDLGTGCIGFLDVAYYNCDSGDGASLGVIVKQTFKYAFSESIYVRTRTSSGFSPWTQIAGAGTTVTNALNASNAKNSDKLCNSTIENFRGNGTGFKYTYVASANADDYWSEETHIFVNSLTNGPTNIAGFLDTEVSTNDKLYFYKQIFRSYDTNKIWVRTKGSSLTTEGATVVAEWKQIAGEGTTVTNASHAISADKATSAESADKAVCNSSGEAFDGAYARFTKCEWDDFGGYYTFKYGSITTLQFTSKVQTYVNTVDGKNVIGSVITDDLAVTINSTTKSPSNCLELLDSFSGGTGYKEVIGTWILLGHISTDTVSDAASNSTYYRYTYLVQRYPD